MGLFDKKYCDICGNEIKFLGNRKIEDGNMCKDCASKLSKWFTGRKKTSLADIKAQLEYRSANARKLESFRASKVIGDYYEFYIDENNRKFFVTNRRGKWKEENPDLIDFDDVLALNFHIEDDQEEVTYEKDGEEVSYNPKRYAHDYTFKVEIRVRNEFFDTMDFDLSQGNGKVTSMNSAAFKDLVEMCDNISKTITGRPFVFNSLAYESDEESVGDNSSTWFCPKCGTENDGNFCKKCGKEKPNAFEPFYCSKCGYKIEEAGIAFCPKCGNKL